MNTTSSATMKTPDGIFSILLQHGEVLASGWTADIAPLVALVHPTLQLALHDVVALGSANQDALITPAVDAIAAYYDGDLAAPDRIPVRQQSGVFRAHAWAVLRQVAPGQRITYTEYAAQSGRPAAVRAAAAACAMNAAALFVPCHRVLRTDGGLGGFRYGLAIKQRLLERETRAEERTTLFD